MVDSTWRMADTRRYALNPQLDLAKILQEAKTRWLRPGEICEIIRNYQRFIFTPDPPYMPTGGSLFLFDRKALRYFRKDGHNWRKKKDGKTVREAHEKLKLNYQLSLIEDKIIECGSVDVLHCYYAHGENNENFQRRSYWMLDGKLEHIVLVHYRDINEPSGSSISSHTLTTDQNRINQQEQQTEPVRFAQTSSNSNASSFQFQQSSPVFEEDSGEELGRHAAPLDEAPAVFNFVPLPGENPLTKERFTGFPTAIHNIYTDDLMSNQVSFQDLILSSEQQKTSIASKVPFSQLATVKSEWLDIGTREQSNSLISFEADLQKGAEDISRGEIFTIPTAAQHFFIGDSERRGDQKFGTLPQFLLSFSANCQQMRKKNMVNDQHHTETSNETTYQLETQTKPFEERKAKDLNKLDSFGRWMSKELVKDCDDSIMAATASDSCNYWKTFDESPQAEDKEVISRHIMQLDADVSLGPSVSQEQLFSIVDFSPEWAYTNVETKVLISGKFLGTADPETIKWGCMFGETEVLAEVLTSLGGALRCLAPPCSKLGRVPFYVTRSNRLACSEIREFEFRANPAPGTQYPLADPEEYRLQVRLANLLSVVPMQRAAALCSVQNCTKCEVWRCLNNELGESSTSNKSSRNGLIEKLMMDRLIKWLGCTLHGEEENRIVQLLDVEGQGIIHLAGALGYDWALGPIVASGISPSFRDACGWTAVHWAAYYGREETVVALVNIGADPAALEDPTSKSPDGRTAADVASSRGHKGIAGFLAEAHLTSHLSLLSLKEGVISDNTDFPESVLVIEGETYDMSLKGSLAALRNSVQAAAKIHTALRVCSFRQREMRGKEKREGVNVLDSVTVVSSIGNRLKLGPSARSNSEPLHSAAAVKIQQKYRGWKGRKEFLKIRDKIVKIQAHVRGHQIRKQYKKVVWSVSIVEKAVLRWRRKGAGLRGFRARRGDALHESGSSDEYDYLSLGRRQKEAGIEKALSRVRSMARSSEGRDQYMRLKGSSLKAKLGDGGSSSSQVEKTGGLEKLHYNSPMIQ